MNLIQVPTIMGFSMLWVVDKESPDNPVSIKYDIFSDPDDPDNVPVDVVKKLGADRVIAVDVLPNFCANQPGGPNVVRPLKHKLLPMSARETYHVQLVMISAITEMRMRETPADILIRPDLPNDMGLFTGFDRAHLAIMAGEKAAEENISIIKALIDN